MTHRAIRLLVITFTAAVLSGCERVFTATPEQRVGYLRELVRARTVARDSLPIDGCSVNRFMEGVPAWRDSLVQAELVAITADAPCPADIQPVQGRFVLLRWYRNWSGEYVIRGATYPWDLGYRFTDGVYVGREERGDRVYVDGIQAPLLPSATDSLVQGMLRGDSTRRGGLIEDDAVTDSAQATPTGAP
ncbi:MAG: hypothetical protein U5K74_05330 [Gemmatimonadaceae bacterium]|nr:hypothetical protein [Gemmatimonadaceae bacterium]